MAILPFYWLLITFICLGSGALLHSIFIKMDGPATISLPQMAVLGATLVAIECVAVSLIFPVSPILIPFFGLQACAGFWLSHKSVNWPDWLRFFKRRDMMAIAAILVFAMAMKAAAPVGSFDAGLYYRQTVLWIQQYGTVPGLGNLHGRLAFNSAWHMFAALFSFDLGQNRTLEDVNEWLVIIFGLEIAGRIIKTEKGPAYPALAVLLAFLLPQFLSAITADLPCIVLTIWVLMTVYPFIFKNTPLTPSTSPGLRRETGADDFSYTNSDSQLLWVVFISTFLILIKLSMLPIAILAAVAWLSIQSIKLKLSLAGIIVVVMACWMGRFYLQTGYVLYPVEQVAALPTHPDWQMPIDFVKNEVDDVEAFAKVPYSVYPADKMANMDRVKMPLQEWSPLWFKGLNGYNRVLLIVFLLSSVAVIARMFARKEGSLILRFGFAGYVISAFALWFLKAPDPRFAYGLLIGLPFLAGLIFFDELQNGHRFYIGASLAIVITCLDMRSLKEHFLLPGPYPVAELKAVTIQNGNVSVPLPANKGAWETRCWNSALPCTYESNPALEHLEMRGPDLSYGFRSIR